EDSSEYKDLTSSFVTILKQVVGGKLPVDYNYHNTPAPWLQIQLLRILRLLGKDDPRISGFVVAILFECVHTIYAIHPKPDLLEKAAKCIGKFVLSPKINLKYLGLKALTYVIQQDSNLALQHQMTIIECLEHPDPIIKRETLELLYRITNEQNVTVIEDIQLRFHAVQSYLSLLEDNNAVYPQKFLQVMSWVLGEYSYLLQNVDPEVVLASLYRILKSNATCETRTWITAAISKIASRTNGSKTVENFLLEFNASLDTSMRQHAFELKYLYENKELMKRFLMSSLMHTALWLKDWTGVHCHTNLIIKDRKRNCPRKKMGKADPAAQKFTRKSKMNESLPNESSSPVESSPSASLFQEGLTGKKDLFVNNGHLKFRKASLHSPEMPESKTTLDRSHSLPEGGLNEKSLDHQFSPSSLFTHDHVDIFHPSPSSPALVQNQLPPTPRLPEEAAQHPHSDISELCGNESLLVYFSKVWKEDNLLIFLFLANKSPSILKDVSLEFQHSEHFKMAESLGCQLAVIESKNIESFQMYVEMEKPWSSGKIFGCISYPLELDVHLRFSISLELLDFIRPMKMSMDEYGKLWLSISNEVKQNLKVAPSQGTLSLMLDTFQQKLKLHIVDIIDCLLYQCQKVMEES
ncbi:AP-4 complex subunit epsilon-1, partial [Ophiophagus hannah]